MVGIGLLGCGAIGGSIAKAIDDGMIEQAHLVSVYDKVKERAEQLAAQMKKRPVVADSFNQFLKEERTQLVVEAASQEAVRSYAEAVLSNGKDLMVMSTGALLDANFYAKISKLALKYHRRVIVPSGAIGGLDAVRASALGGLREVVLVTRKPPSAYRGAPYAESKGIALDRIYEETVLFDGPATEAVRGFPQNVNVAAVISIAGIGGLQTKVRVIADPKLTANIHEVHLSGDFGRMSLRFENTPHPENPRTSYLAVLSAIETLRSIVSDSVKIGT